MAIEVTNIFSGKSDVSIEFALQIAKQHLEALDSKLLLEHILNCDRAYLIANRRQILTTAQQKTFSKNILRRKKGEPLAYIVGSCGFYGRKFIVNENVLIPRADSEILVEVVLDKYSADTTFSALDLGCGSGCLGITIGLERKNCQMSLGDISPDALNIAQINANNHNLSAKFYLTNWFSQINQSFDLIVSNPPYLASDDQHLKENGLNFEPILALCGQGIVSDPSLELLHIINNANKFLRYNAWLIVEHAFDQAEICQKYFQLAGYSAIFTAKDLSGNDRVTAGQWRT